MAPSAALIIAIAALVGVIVQSAIEWSPAMKHAGSGASGKLGASTQGALASASGLVPHNSRDAVPSGWANMGDAHGSTALSMRIALPSKDAAGMRQVLMDVSTPGHPQYGQHLNSAQVRMQWT
jgi:hypothetical protein